MMAGLEQISNLILLYKARESLYLKNPLPTDPTVEEFEHRVIDLYAKILEYQLRMYLHLGRKAYQRGARNLIKLDDWSGWSTKILALDAQCFRFTGIIDIGREHVYMSSQSDYARMQIDLDKRILHVMETILLRQRESSNNECVQALSSDYEGQKNLVPQRVPDTCQWFLTHQKFLDWRAKESSALLWVSAEPGCGKSVLARCLIDERFLSKNTTTSTICYFFFKDGQEGRNESHHALAALLHRLFSSNLAEDLIGHAELSYKNHGDKLSSMFTELWSILMKVVADPNAGEIVCLIDALDECRAESRNVFLRTLIDFYEHERVSTTSTTRLKFIITSRPYSDIHEEFAQLTQVSSEGDNHCSGEDESEKISREIDLVIAARVPKQLSRLKPEVQQQIIEHLCKIKGRTYLWLHLTLDLVRKNLATLKTVEEIEDFMANLSGSADLYKIYEALLEKSSNLAQAKLLLQIITVARRPLTLRELKVAWGIAKDKAGKCSKYEDLKYHLEEDPNFPTDLRALCGLLISIYDGQVYLLHLTVREFLIGQSAKALPPNETQFDIAEAEQLMAAICTKYLAFNTFEHLELPDYISPYEPESAYLDKVSSIHKRFVFLQYAAQHWFVHLQLAQHQARTREIETGLQLVRAGSVRCRLWLSEWCRRLRFKCTRWCRWDDLTIAAAIGVTMIAKVLLPSQALVDGHDRKDSPLWAAANWGHVEIVGLLLAEGFDINSDDFEGIPALATAAREGRQSVVELLLEHGAEHHLEAVDETSGTTPAPTLLGTPNSSHGGGTTVLNIDAHNGDGITALHFALKSAFKSADKNSSFEVIARLLIEKGADCEGQSQYGYTPLLTAVEVGSEVVTGLLLDKGVDINIKDVQYAVRYGRERILKLLLGRGADLHTHNDNGEGLVALAVKCSRGNILKLLLDHGADINARDTKYNDYSALDQAVWQGKQDIVKLLLEKGAEFGMAPTIAAALGSEKVLELLLDKGADLETRDQDGDTALTNAAMEGQEKIVKLLLERGANINARNGSGNSALIFAIRRAHEEIAQILIDHGADINTRNEDGHNALDYATLQGKETIAQTLVDHGADISPELQDWPSKQLQSLFGE